jgi:hypothetical protein
LVTPLEDLEHALKEIQINKKFVKVIVSPDISQRIYF